MKKCWGWGFTLLGYKGPDTTNKTTKKEEDAKAKKKKIQRKITTWSI